MKIKVLKPFVTGAGLFSVGQNADIPNAEAEKLISKGRAEKIIDAPVESKKAVKKNESKRANS